MKISKLSHRIASFGGTGPFRFVEWVSDEKIVLGANPRYFEGRPGLDGIIFRIIPYSQRIRGGTTSLIGARDIAEERLDPYHRRIS